MLKKDNEKLPGHVAIIMDGNGRWARERNMPRTRGHKRGAERVKEIVSSASSMGIDVLTLFAFSAENWSRPKREVDKLMGFLERFLDDQLPVMIKNGIRFLAIGRKNPLPARLLRKITEVTHKTSSNRKMTLVLALNYGSRQEIVDAARACAKAAVEGNLSPEEIDEGLFAGYLYTSGLSDPDLVIRTSGEMRLSNFLLWQSSYTELYFPNKYWPDFGPEDLREAVAEYARRKRRFGGIDVKEKNN